MSTFKQDVLQTIIDTLKPMPDILAAWEGGSKANGTSDQYSDVDLSIYSKTPLQEVLERVEASLAKYNVVHAYRETKSAWGAGMLQRFIFLKDAPDFFYVDVAAFDGSNEKLMNDFFEVERHGTPVIHFDKQGIVKLTHTDLEALFKRQQNRLAEILQIFPVYKTLVQKEMQRGKAIDAIAFYQNGLVRPLVEVLGMVHRPYKFDFGFRYLHSQMPPEVSRLVEDLLYVPDVNCLPSRLLKLETALMDAAQKVKAKKGLLS